MDTTKEINFRTAYSKISDSVPKSWYIDEATQTRGIIWHFTDINNMANILSYKKITSKNYGTEQNIIRNNNAYAQVNDNRTQSWVHDYARFYFRPKTPTQYRNEGIYQYNGDDLNNPKFELPRRLLNSNGDIWTKDYTTNQISRPAHLPIPIFIGFSLDFALKKGGIVTKHSLAGSKNIIPEDSFDINLDEFVKNINIIYDKSNNINKRIRHTEFIMKDYLDFEPEDIVKIVTRTEAEKLALLTLLAEHNMQLFSTKEQHIDLYQYAKKIIIDPSFFYDDVGALSLKETNNIIVFRLNDEIDSSNVRIHVSNPIRFKKIVDHGEIILNITIEKQKRYEFRVVDINKEEKNVGVIHDPFWILSTDYWNNSRYYSEIYLNNNYYKIYRKRGSNVWYDDRTKQEINFLNDKAKLQLREVEESYKSIKEK